MHARTAGLGGGGELDPVSGEAVTDELGPHPIRIPVLAEHRE
jgi:hypothetical protein